jgi:hypothetical protein
MDTLRSINLRLPESLIEGYRKAGPGYQTRMREALQAGLKAVEREEAIRRQHEVLREIIARNLADPTPPDDADDGWNRPQ